MCLLIADTVRPSSLFVPLKCNDLYCVEEPLSLLKNKWRLTKVWPVNWFLLLLFPKRLMYLCCIFIPFCAGRPHETKHPVYNLCVVLTLPCSLFRLHYYWTILIILPNSSTVTQLKDCLLQWGIHCHSQSCGKVWCWLGLGVNKGADHEKSTPELPLSNCELPHETMVD